MDVLDVLTGYQGAAIVTAACRLGVFDVLGDRPCPADEVAARLRTAPGPTRALLDSLVALGLVSAGYTAAPDAAPLRSGGELALVVAKEAVLARLWQDLDQVVRTGRPLLAPWAERVARDPEGVLGFLGALEVLARRTGPPLHELPELAPGRRVLDVGGGLGSYARALAAAGSQVTLVDLPVVAGAARERLRDVAGVTVVAADVLTAPACGVEPAGHDAALVSHLLHDLPADQGIAVLRAAAAAVRPGGAVVVNEFAGDAGPDGFGPRFDLMMRLETGGAAYPVDDLVEMLRSAGLGAVRRVAFPEPVTVLCGEVR